ncbi:fatty acid desaturase-domain-containing protein [Mycena amicta]|nr:fatty acid desaturase-domain-containing protein [Mycena amicta]
MDDPSSEEFQLLSMSMKEIRAAIPPQCFVRDTYRGLQYLARDVALAACAFAFAMAIDPSFACLTEQKFSVVFSLLRWGAWCAYWWFQSLIFTGVWVLGHECGHGAFSPHKHVNDAIGFLLHSALFTPYFSWKITHHRHHMYHASMTRDETFVPCTRSEVGIPQAAHASDYEEYFGDTPLYTLLFLIRQQLLGFPAYLLFNVSGSRRYPKGTNHFAPSSPLFTSAQRNVVILSNLGLGAAFLALFYACLGFGVANVVKFYFLPWIGVTHWFVMITYLQHTHSRVPHYRDQSWTFQRGAVATIDRPNFLGWQGRFFLHNVVQYHTIHHFFPRIPFYHGPEATRHLKQAIGEHYVSCDQPAFQALWEVKNQCRFVEDTGLFGIPAKAYV